MKKSYNRKRYEIFILEQKHVVVCRVVNSLQIKMLQIADGGGL
jgi:hypothetical protein